MRLFMHRGPGHYIGSLLILFANSREEAERMVRAELDKHGLEKEAVDVEEVPIQHGFVYVADGDY